MEGDYIMIMPPIKLKTILEPTIVFFNFINNYCFSISCAQWHLWFMQKQWFPLINFCRVCDPSYMPLFVFAWQRVLFIVVMSPWYSCKKWSLIEEDFSNQPFEFHFDKKKVDIGSKVHIGSRHIFELVLGLVVD